MRERKYRGQKTSTGEWKYGSLIVDSGNGAHCIVQIRANPVSNGVITGWCFGVKRETVGEFTGLQDKDGTDIYEGDNVRSGMTGAQYTIMFGEYQTKNSSGIGFWKKAINGATDRCITSDSSVQRVIGNIHEK
jgi:uncharacterized phage protein (TIGR01671 family)